jgi:OOP family OmpA-OmpF porin
MNFKSIVATYLFINLLGGCTIEPTIEEVPITANVKSEIDNMNNHVYQAEIDLLGLLSPQSFTKASEFSAKANNDYTKNLDARKTLKSVAYVNAYLKRGYENAPFARSSFRDILEARNDAIDRGGMVFFDEKFTQVDKHFIKSTSKLESQNVKDLNKDQVVLMDEYKSISLMALKLSFLGPSRSIINQAILLGAKKLAPQSLALAEENYKIVEKYIDDNPKLGDQIEPLSQEAFRNANHVFKITQDSLVAKKSNSEDVALQIDAQDKLIKQQQKNAEYLNKTSRELNSENAALSNYVMEQQKEMDEVSTINSSVTKLNTRMAGQLSLDDKFEKAQQLFSKEEAEIYKQGSVLTIRLRGLKFPSSGSLITPSNKVLLNKVQAIIKEFKSLSVVIEGHSDSIGSQEVNKKLSGDRAIAVKDYLISLGTIEKENIFSLGQGYSKPLATNKTANGRAQNRRVDVFIGM